ncbi:MAG: hypothetical protein WBC93_22430 [Sulfitobacter sp.]
MTKLTFPESERAFVLEKYRSADVILEYGSGGSTIFAAEQPGKYIMSVESDRDWAINIQAEIDQADLPSDVIVHHVDIGEIGLWGRPVDAQGWAKYHHYPLNIWTQPFFRQPDLVLIDGRLRPACLVATCLRAKKKVTVLFDDYANRPAYHVVEKLVKPVRYVGRIAEFEITPNIWPNWAEDFLHELCTKVTFSVGTVSYQASL